MRGGPRLRHATTQSKHPVAVSGGLTFSVLSAGNAHTCGVTRAGVAYCWGINRYGELGNGTTTSRTTPATVAGGLSFATVAAAVAGDHTCGVTTAGAASCWGYNLSGQLGNGATLNSATPVAVSGGLTFANVSVGLYHSCGVTTTGVAYCWGYNLYDQLGDGSAASSTVPVRVVQ